MVRSVFIISLAIVFVYKKLLVFSFIMIITTHTFIFIKFIVRIRFINIIILFIYCAF